MTTAPKENARQQGFALLVVLWIVTLLALQISIFNLSVRDAGTLAGNELAMARGEALAAAGVELAAARLTEPDAEWRWSADGRTRQVRFGGARLYIAVADEAGRLDINEMDAEVLKSLLRPSACTAEAVTGWIDRNGPFLDPTQLATSPSACPPARCSRLLPTYGAWRRWQDQPARCVTRGLLMLPGIDPAEVERALALRQRGEATAADVARLLGSVDKWLTERTGPAYRVEVAVRGETMAAIGWAEATILIGKDAAAPFRVLGWRYEPRAPESQVRDQR